MKKNHSCSCTSDSIGAKKKSLIDNAIDFLPQAGYAGAGIATAVGVDYVTSKVDALATRPNIVSGAKALLGIAIAGGSRKKTMQAYGIGMFAQAVGGAIVNAVSSVTDSLPGGAGGSDVNLLSARNRSVNLSQFSNSINRGTTATNVSGSREQAGFL